MKNQEIKILDDGRIVEIKTSDSGIITKTYYSPKQWNELNNKTFLTDFNFFDFAFYVFCLYGSLINTHH